MILGVAMAENLGGVPNGPIDLKGNYMYLKILTLLQASERT